VYALREAAVALLRHPVSSLATFTTASVSFALLTLTGLFLWNLDMVIGAAEGELEVAAFLAPGSDPQAVAAEVRRSLPVARVRVITKDQALRELTESFPYLAEAGELVENPLPDTLLVTPRDPDRVEELAAALSRVPGVQEVEYGGRFTLELLKVARGVRVGALALILMLVINTFFSVMGTIRLSIESRRDELEVMQLVGATRGMILLPFVVEGLLLTTSAATLALAVAVPIYRFLAAKAQEFFPFLPVLSPGDLAKAALALYLLAAFLGAVGGWLSSRAQIREAGF